MDVGLTGKTVLITGGSSGIGKATALLYGLEKGVNVALTYFEHQVRADAVVAQIRERGGSALAVPLSLADHASIESAVQTVAETFGSIDVLVNNAVQWGSDNRGKRLEEMPLAQWQETVGVNLLGTVRVTQLVAPYMRKRRWGRIVNVSSDVALDSMVGSGPYGSLKAALLGFTANLVTELSADGILSNVVIPGWTLTDRAIAFFPEAFRETAQSAFPTGRVTLPEDVASLIVYLGSAANGHVNGESVKVTGKGSQAMLSAMFRDFMARQNATPPGYNQSGSA